MDYSEKNALFGRPEGVSTAYGGPSGRGCSGLAAALHGMLGVVRMDPIQDSDDDSLTLCCGGRKCPTIEHKSGGFRLSDDEEGATPVQLSDGQLEMLVRWGARKLGLKIQG